MRLTPRPPDPLDFSLSTITYYNRHRIPQTRVAHTHSLGWAFFLGIWRILEHPRNPISSTDKPFYTLGLFSSPVIFIRFLRPLSCRVLVYFLSLRFASLFNTFPQVNCVSKVVFYLFASVCDHTRFPPLYLSLGFFPSSFSSLNAFCCMCILLFQSSLYPQTSQTTSRIYIIVTETMISSK